MLNVTLNSQSVPKRLWVCDRITKQWTVSSYAISRTSWTGAICGTKYENLKIRTRRQLVWKRGLGHRSCITWPVWPYHVWRLHWVCDRRANCADSLALINCVRYRRHLSDCTADIYRNGPTRAGRANNIATWLSILLAVSLSWDTRSLIFAVTFTLQPL